MAQRVNMSAYCECGDLSLIPRTHGTHKSSDVSTCVSWYMPGTLTFLAFCQHLTEPFPSWSLFCACWDHPVKHFVFAAKFLFLLLLFSHILYPDTEASPSPPPNLSAPTSPLPRSTLPLSPLRKSRLPRDISQAWHNMRL